MNEFPAVSTSFLESKVVHNMGFSQTRIKSGFSTSLLTERIIFGKKTQKSQVSLLRYLTFSLVCGRIWQRGAPAGSPAVRVVGRVRASGTQATSRPSRQARPSPSHEFLLAFRSFLSVRTCSQPFSSPPAPKTHPVSPFSGFSGCVFLFFAAFWPQNFHAGFCASCRIAVTS